MKRIKWVGLFLLLFATACSSSKITSSWKADAVVPKNYNRLLVLGLIKDNDRSIQQDMENHLVGDLQALGYNAVSSLKEYGPQAFDKMDEHTAIEKLKTSGVDAVITIVLLDKDRERKYVPAHMNYSPFAYYHNNFWGYRTTLYSRIYEPGYYTMNTNYFWESNLYEMATQQLAYSVQTKSFDPSTTAAMAHEYGKMIVKNMLKQHILKDKEEKVADTNTLSSAD